MMDVFNRKQIKIGLYNYDFSSLSDDDAKKIYSWYVSLMPNEVVFYSQRNLLARKTQQFFDEWVNKQSPTKYSISSLTIYIFKGWIVIQNKNLRVIGRPISISLTKSDRTLSSRSNNGYRVTGGYWLYQRKDGNPDRRYKNNYYTYQYVRRTIIMKLGSFVLSSETHDKDSEISKWESFELKILQHKGDKTQLDLFNEHLTAIELPVLRDRMIKYCKYPKWVPSLIKESKNYLPLNYLWDQSFDPKLEAFRKSLVGNSSLVTTPIEAFEFDKDTQTIINYDETFGYSVVVPEVIKGVTVHALGEYSFYKKHILFLELPDSIQEIHGFALAKNHLKTFNIPKNIKSISSTSLQKNPLFNVIYDGIEDHVKEFITKLGFNILTSGGS
jgi:hypothetical protein